MEKYKKAMILCKSFKVKIKRIKRICKQNLHLKRADFS